MIASFIAFIYFRNPINIENYPIKTRIDIIRHPILKAANSGCLILQYHTQIILSICEEHGILEYDLNKVDFILFYDEY